MHDASPRNGGRSSRRGDGCGGEHHVDASKFGREGGAQRGPRGGMGSGSGSGAGGSACLRRLL